MKFFDFLIHFRSHESYVADYAADDLVEGNLHVIVWKLPKPLCDRNIFELFLQGKYSEMYTMREIVNMVPKTIEKVLETGQVIDVLNAQYSVLTKDPQFFKKFQKKVRKDFKTSIVLDEDVELDYPPIRGEEWLNFID